MALDETMTNGGTGGYGTSWGLIIFFLILFWFFTGGGFGGFGGYRANAMDAGADILRAMQREGSLGCVKQFDIEKQNAQDTAAILQGIHNLQDNVGAAVTASTNQLAAQSRLQYDAQQGEKMFDLKLERLSQQQSYEAQLAAKDATIERMRLAENLTAQFTALQAEIAGIKCSMLTKPQVTGVGAVCPNSGIINGLGITGGLGGCNGYNGYNGIA